MKIIQISLVLLLLLACALAFPMNKNQAEITPSHKAASGVAKDQVYLIPNEGESIQVSLETAENFKLVKDMITDKENESYDTEIPLANVAHPTSKLTSEERNVEEFLKELETKSMIQYFTANSLESALSLWPDPKVDTMAINQPFTGCSLSLKLLSNEINALLLDFICLQTSCILGYREFIRQTDRSDLYLLQVSGKPSGCPSARLSLSVYEAISKKFGVERIILGDDSRYPIKYKDDTIFLNSWIYGAVFNNNPVSYYEPLGYSYTNEEIPALRIIASNLLQDMKVSDILNSLTETGLRLSNLDETLLLLANEKYIYIVKELINDIQNEGIEEDKDISWLYLKNAITLILPKIRFTEFFDFSRVVSHKERDALMLLFSRSYSNQDLSMIKNL